MYSPGRQVEGYSMPERTRLSVSGVIKMCIRDRYEVQHPMRPLLAMLRAKPATPTVKGAVIRTLSLIHIYNPGQRLLTYKCTVVHLLAEGICRNAIGRIYLNTVWLSPVLACIHADGGIGNVQQLQVFEFIP